MSEKFKSRFEIDMDASKKVSIRFNGRVSKKGVTQSENYNGKKFAVFYASVANQTDRLVKALGVPKDLLMTSTSENGDEYLTIPVQYYGFSADRALENIHAGDIVEVCASVNVAEKDGKKYVNFRSMWSPVLVKANDSASESKSVESEPESAPETTNSIQPEMTDEALDIEDDMLPF